MIVTNYRGNPKAYVSDVILISNNWRFTATAESANELHKVLKLILIINGANEDVRGLSCVTGIIALVYIFLQTRVSLLS